MSSREYMAWLWNGPNRPKWAQPYRPYAVASRMIYERYQRRQRSRTKANDDSEYARYLLSPYWQLFRKCVMVFAGGMCARCGAVADHIHHLHYQTLGRERLCDVEPLCEGCHNREHQKGAIQ
jgi:5-methylcytosine-specific restriction endonuclease McrA